MDTLKMKYVATAYEFQLVHNEIKSGEAAVLAVRLVDKRSGKLVPDAVICTNLIAMALDGIETKTTPIEQLPSDEPGIYRFRANLPTGDWRLSLGAKLQGQIGTLESRLNLKAAP